MSRKAAKKGRDGFRFLLIATVLTLIISFVPLAWVAVYPIRLFITFIHEGGHALAALATLGSVDSLVIYADASGETYTRGGIQMVIASAGYLTTTAFGAALLILGSRGDRPRAVLTVCAAIILALTAFFARDPFSWVLGLILTAGLMLVALSFKERAAHLFLSFLAVQCCLNALFDLRTLFWASAMTSVPSDAVTMERLTLIPATAWAVFWLILSILTLLFALRSYRAHLPKI